MKFPIVTRRRFEDELAAAKAETSRQRQRAENAEKTAETAKFNRGQALDQNAALDAANRRLDGRNRALAERLEAAQVGSGFDAAAAKTTANRIAELVKEAAQARAEAAEARALGRQHQRQAEHLQKRLDEALGMEAGRIQDSAPWQPGFQKPNLGKEASAS